MVDACVTVTLTHVINRISSRESVSASIIHVGITVISAVNHLYRKSGEKPPKMIPLNVNVSNVGNLFYIITLVLCSSANSFCISISLLLLQNPILISTFITCMSKTANGNKTIHICS